MEQKIILAAIFCMVLLSHAQLVSAVQTQIFNFFDNGFVIIGNDGYTIEKNQDHTFNFFVHNKSNGISLSNETINCTFYLANSSGEVILTIPATYESEGYWSALVKGGNLSEVGSYFYGIMCINSEASIGGTFAGTLYSTYHGDEINSGKGLLYLALFIVLVLFFILIMYGITKLPSSNARDEEGRILSINYLKYLRPVLMFTEWMILIAILYLSSNLAFAYLTEELFAQVLFTLFKICLAITPIIVVLWIVWIFVKIAEDKKLNEMIRRGIFPERL